MPQNESESTASNSFDSEAEKASIEKTPTPFKPTFAQPEPLTKAATQAKLANILLASLVGVYLIIFVLLLSEKWIIFYILRHFETMPLPTELNFQDNSKDLITLLLSTSSALAGTVLGFYFNRSTEGN